MEVVDDEEHGGSLAGRQQELGQGVEEAGALLVGLEAGELGQVGQPGA